MEARPPLALSSAGSWGLGRKGSRGTRKADEEARVRVQHDMNAHSNAPWALGRAALSADEGLPLLAGAVASVRVSSKAQEATGRY
jgi:hypothetical protein